ncbi:hypothetical protein D9613_004452 [Agrocybe pediades]|uniref:Uncharacterized protein n=1 Tax=Agrocybe pediades TaxID=84607 RepID=A0A8H4QI11_9AGAR|nr:hypothetical protein D9613_004452 [Agrocybe pediades]
MSRRKKIVNSSQHGVGGGLGAEGKVGDEGGTYCHVALSVSATEPGIQDAYADNVIHEYAIVYNKTSSSVLREILDDRLSQRRHAMEAMKHPAPHIGANTTGSRA